MELKERDQQACGGSLSDCCIETINALALNNPMIIVYNKTDCLDHQDLRIDRDEHGRPKRVWLSAGTGDGLDLLMEASSNEGWPTV